MRVTCKTFQASILPDGLIQLDIENPDTESLEPQAAAPDPVLHRSDVARIMGVSTRTVTRLAKRDTDPLPFDYSLGKPFILASNLHKFLAGQSAAALPASENHYY